MRVLFLFSLLLTYFNLQSQVINEDLVNKHISYLSSDELEGRKSGTQGIELAAQYIEKEFETIGLKTFNSDNYRQNFESRGLNLFNVIGLLEGKEKPNEYIVISAHYDHIGINNDLEGDNIFNGANDNASGTTAVLSLAKHYKELDSNSRSILFVLFTAEEMGLIGSRYFGEKINPDSIIAGINIEMIGKESPFGEKTAWLTGFDRSNFGKIVQKNLEGSEYKLYPDPFIGYRLFYRSDNAALARLGIPAHTFLQAQWTKI